jgi:hypothetical protein
MGHIAHMRAMKISFKRFLEGLNVRENHRDLGDYGRIILEGMFHA